MYDISMIEKCFPFGTFREGQREAIEFAANAFNNGKKFVILEAPTGAGKSAIATCLSNMVQNSYYLTVTKILQDQLVREFGDEIVELKGRASYPCTYWALHGPRLVEKQALSQKALANNLAANHNCGDGYCVTDAPEWAKKGRKCLKCFIGPDGDGRFAKQLPPGMKYSSCPYYEQVEKALVAPKVVMNFHAFLYQTSMSHRFDSTRDLLIVDEAHNAEGILMDFISISMDDKLLQKYGKALPHLEHAAEYAIWFEQNGIGDLLTNAYNDLSNELISSKDVKAKQVIIRELDDLGRMARRYKIFMESMVAEHGAEWVAEFGQVELAKSTYNKVTLKPVMVGDFAHTHLLKYGQNVLLMSATILDVDVFCRSIGVEVSEVASYRMKNRFPVESRPIFYQPVAKITGGKGRQGEWGPKLIDAVQGLIRNYPNQRGIVHTHNFAIADMLYEQCDQDVRERFSYQRSFLDKSALLDYHAFNEGSVLLAPAMHEGIDLVGELCYDQETEILTEFGWAELPKLIEGVAVAAYDDNTGMIGFEVPSQVICGRYADWVEFDTMTNNLMVTAPHRMLWHNSQTGNTKETRADEAPANSKYQFITAGGYIGPGLPLSDDQLRLAAAYQADGCWASGTDRRMRFDFRRPRKVSRLKEILGRLGYQYQELETKRGDKKLLVDKAHFVPLKMLGDWDHDKLWNLQNLLKLTIQQRRVLLGELSFWDGTQAESTYHDKWVYCSSLRENLDTIQAIAAVSNLRSDYNGHRLTYRDTTFATFVPGEHNYIIKHYDTTLPCYCVTVSTGWVVVRRRGKVTISGNSRFQIICKIPYPNFYENKQMTRRMEIDKAYYDWLTALKLVQSYGRSIRSNTDYADTYIIDGAFDFFYSKAKRILPSWFREAIVR